MSRYRELLALLEVLVYPQIFRRLLKCPPEQFQGIMQGAGGGFLRSEDGSSQDFANGVDSVWHAFRQVRPRPHPPDEYPAPFGPGPEETGAGAFEVGAENDEALDFGRLDRHEPLGDGGQEPTILEDRAQEEAVVGYGTANIPPLLCKEAECLGANDRRAAMLRAGHWHPSVEFVLVIGSGNSICP